jgi:hypothetical protein
MTTRDESGFVPDEIPDLFWQRLAEAGNDRDVLRRIMEQMGREELLDFYRVFYDAAVELTDSPFSDYTGDLSEDDAASIAEWVVSQGRDYFMAVWRDPESIPKKIDATMTPSSFADVASKVFHSRFGESIIKASGVGWWGNPKSTP